MSAIIDIIGGFRRVEGEVLRVEEIRQEPFAVVDPRKLQIEVAAGSSAKIVVLHTKPEEARLSVALAENAQLEMTEVFIAEDFAEAALTQAAGSRSKVTTIQLTSANVRYLNDLNGEEAESELYGLFLGTADEHCELRLRTNHNMPACRSNTFVKGVAGGRALGEFHGMVYVAPDAQHTDARQQSRNILLSETARIITQPQLEIYADDVKCSHGATVGQPDDEALFYMRQRGLSEQQARRLQIEGFVGDIVRRCGIEELAEAVMETVSGKLKVES